MEFVLLVAGAVFALLFVLNNILQILRRKVELRFWGTLLAFLATVVTLLALVQSTTAGSLNPNMRSGVIAIAVLVIVSGIVVLIIEILRPQRNLVQSRGILGIGIGLLLVLSTFTVPLMAAYLAVPLESSATVAASSGQVDEAAITAEQDTRAYTNLIQSASTQTGVAADDLLLELTGNTSLSQAVQSKGGDPEVVLNDALSTTRTQVESLIASGQIPRLQGTLMLANLESDLRSKLGEQITSNQIEALAPAILATSTPTQMPTRTYTPVPTLTSTPTYTATPSRTPRPTDTPTPTRLGFITRTPSPTPTLPDPCLATVDYNLNLRTEPNAEAEVITTIPFDTAVPVFGSNEDHTWWYVRYDDQVGWVDGEYITRTDACDALPVRQ